MVGVVVLNFNNFQCTIQCVNCLLKQDIAEVKICIVDNGSSNDSVKLLNCEFEKYNNVVVVSNTRNMGFARGNNIGIDYLRSKCCQDILIINSDVYMEESSSLRQLLEHKREGLGLISPIAYNYEDSRIESIFLRKKDTFYADMKQELETAIRVKFKYYLYSIRSSLVKYLKHLDTTPEQVVHWDGNYEALLQDFSNQDAYIFTGGVFLLTSEFFKHYRGLFSKTFLYYEEWATTVLLYQANLDAEAIDVGAVYHIGGASTSNRTLAYKNKHELISATKILLLLLSGKC